MPVTSPSSANADCLLGEANIELAGNLRFAAQLGPNEGVWKRFILAVPDESGTDRLLINPQRTRKPVRYVSSEVATHTARQFAEERQQSAPHFQGLMRRMDRLDRVGRLSSQL
jgi:hypothetical protein